MQSSTGFFSNEGTVEVTYVRKFSISASGQQPTSASEMKLPFSGSVMTVDTEISQSDSGTFINRS